MSTLRTDLGTTSSTTHGDVFVNINGKSLHVRSPYLPSFIKRARDLNGKFNRDTSEWIFDARDIEQVKKTLVDYYGTDGSEVPAVDVLVDLDKYPWDGDTYAGFGRVVCSRAGGILGSS